MRIGADIQLANESTRFELINTKLGDSLDFRFAIRNLGPETADSLRLDYMGIGMNNGFFYFTTISKLERHMASSRNSSRGSIHNHR